MNKIETVTIFDIEFINQKDFYQPIQVSFCAFDLPLNKATPLVKDNVYIKTLHKRKVSRFVTRYTGINDDLLKNEGLRFGDAKKRILRFLKEYDPKTTILLGWDISNDLQMFDKLFRYHSLFSHINKFRWVDLSRIYKGIKNLKTLSSLKNACEEYNITTDRMHNAVVDVELTYELLIKLIDEYGEQTIFYNSNETKFTKRRKIKKVPTK